MGWTFTAKPFGQSSRRYLDAQLTWTNESGTRRVLRSAMVGSTYYAAVEFTKADGSREVWAAITLTKSDKRAADGLTFGYKDMSEDMGPYEADCPTSILDLLTETQIPYALAWREKCRAHAARKKARPKVGDVITLAAPLKFSNGAMRSKFKVEKQATWNGRTRTVYRSLEDGLAYRLTSLLRYDFTITHA